MPGGGAQAHEKVFQHIHDLCMTNGVEGRRGVSPRPTGGLEELNYAAGRRVYLEALFSEQKRAIVAVAHSILTDTYYILKLGTSYKDLGADHFDRLQRDRIRRYHVRRLGDLGYKVSIVDERGEEHKAA